MIRILLSLLFVSLTFSIVSAASITTPSTRLTIGDMGGNPTYGTGKHILEYFRDYQCPGCYDFTTRFLPVFEKYAEAGQITLIYRQYPLSYHQNSYQDALAALCAHDQGYYREYSEKIYALEKKKAGKNISPLERIRLTNGFAGFDKSEFRICVRSEKYTPVIEDDLEKGQNYGVTGIPMLLLDSREIPLDAFATTDDLEKILADRLAR